MLLPTPGGCRDVERRNLGPADLASALYAQRASLVLTPDYLWPRLGASGAPLPHLRLSLTGKATADAVEEFSALPRLPRRPAVCVMLHS